MYQRIEIVIDLSPKDTHRRLPFSWKNRNARSLAANAPHFATFRFDWSSRPGTRGSAFHAPPGFIALQHARRFCLIGGSSQGRGYQETLDWGADEGGRLGGYSGDD
jgi:hypothetical protein